MKIHDLIDQLSRVNDRNCNPDVTTDQSPAGAASRRTHLGDPPHRAYRPCRSGRRARTWAPACHISLSATAFNSFSNCCR